MDGLKLAVWIIGLCMLGLLVFSVFTGDIVRATYYGVLYLITRAK